jgi:hypothetical protein
MDHIINICGFPVDSTIVGIFKWEGWSDIADIAMITMQEADWLQLTNIDGSYKPKPMTFHLRRYKAFLMYYNRKCRDLSTTPNDEDVLSISTTDLITWDHHHIMMTLREV